MAAVGANIMPLGVWTRSTLMARGIEWSLVIIVIVVVIVRGGVAEVNEVDTGIADVCARNADDIRARLDNEKGVLLGGLEASGGDL